jgi:putative SOS response-associated peptidase YedK
MCGRFEIHSTLEIIAQIFGIDDLALDYRPSYNIAPSQDILLVVNNGKRRLIQSRWGFIPSWSKDLSTGYRMINARAESLAEKRSFKTAFEKQRCLVIADGFYEWKKEGATKKPFYIRLKSKQPFGFAGLYNAWTSPDGGEIITSTIITTDSNELIQLLHNRMPVIASPDNYDLWLDASVHDKDILMPLLKPFPSESMELYAVTQKMNSIKHNDPENIKPVKVDEAG